MNAFVLVESPIADLPATLTHAESASLSLSDFIYHCGVTFVFLRCCREQDARFETSQRSDLLIHPASCLTGALTSIGSHEVIVYGELLETQRSYLCNVTPCWGLPAVLLSARSVDCDAVATRSVAHQRVYSILALQSHSAPVSSL